MADWVHCNLCFRQPGDGKKFVLTNCGHIYCDNCINVGTRDRCQMCKVTCTTIPLSSKMKADVEIFFTDPVHIIKKQEKQLVQVIDFQKNHRQRLTAYNREKLTRQNQLMSNAQEAVQKTQDLEREIMVLKQENAYLRRLISRGSSPKTSPKTNGVGSPPNSRQNTPSGGRKTPVNPGAYSNAVPHYPKSPDSSVSPSVHKNQSMIRPGRITVRTPPSDGRMGGIVGSPAGSAMSPGNAAGGTPMACSPSHSYFLKLHAGDTPTNPLKPTTPGTPAALAMFKPVVSGRLSRHPPSSVERKPIQLAYNPCSSMSARVQGLGQTGKHKVCIFNIKKLKHDNNVLLEQTVKLRKNLQRMLVKERTDRTKLDEAKEEIKVLKKMLDTETTKEDKLKEVHQQMDILQKEKNALQDERNQLTETLAFREEDIKTIAAEASEDLTQSREVITSLEDKIKQFMAQHEKQNEKVEQLQKESTEKENMISSLTEKILKHEKDLEEFRHDSSILREEKNDKDTLRKTKQSTPVRKTTPFVPKTPRTSNVKLTPRIGCKTPGQSIILMPTASGGIKRSMTAVLQFEDNNNDTGSIFRSNSAQECGLNDINSEARAFKLSPKKAKMDSSDADNWSLISSGNTEDGDKDFQFRPHSQRRYKIKGKRRKKTLRIEN